jgi:hypothetical protein
MLNKLQNNLKKGESIGWPSDNKLTIREKLSMLLSCEPFNFILCL